MGDSERPPSPLAPRPGEAVTLRDRATYLPGGLPRPVPQPDGLDAPYWEGTQRGELRVQRCRACRAWQWGPEWICHACLSFDLAWGTNVEPIGAPQAIAAKVAATDEGCGKFAFQWDTSWGKVILFLDDHLGIPHLIEAAVAAGTFGITISLVGLWRIATTTTPAKSRDSDDMKRPRLRVRFPTRARQTIRRTIPATTRINSRATAKERADRRVRRRILRSSRAPAARRRLRCPRRRRRLPRSQADTTSEPAQVAPPLIRASRTFSPQAGRRATRFTLPASSCPSPREAGRGRHGAERSAGEGRVIALTNRVRRSLFARNNGTFPS